MIIATLPSSWTVDPRSFIPARCLLIAYLPTLEALYMRANMTFRVSLTRMYTTEALSTEHYKLYGHWTRVIAVFWLIVLPLLALLPRLLMLVSMNMLDPTNLLST